MKKIFLILTVFMAISFKLKAQQYVAVNDLNASVQVTTLDPRVIGDHSAILLGSIGKDDVDEVGFEYKKLTNPQVQVAIAQLTGNNFDALVDDLELNAMYSVKAYAKVGDDVVYGNEIHFHTWVEGVSELQNSLNVYPNPARDLLTVEGEMTSIEIYNTVGQCLLVKQVEGDSQIDLSSFDNGVYFLRVCNNEEMVVRKFSVSR